jgi:hypothetical protein
MTHFAFFARQITKKIIRAGFFISISLAFFACTGSQSKTDNERTWCMRQVDTLWILFAETKKNFVFNMDEIAERKTEMDSQLRLAAMLPAESYSEQDKAMLTQFNSILKVYKPISGKYRNAVLETEDIFYQIKALEKSVREGFYDKRLDDFKKTYADLNQKLQKTAMESKEIGDRLKAVEPMYLRLAPKVEDILAKVSHE